MDENDSAQLAYHHNELNDVLSSLKTDHHGLSVNEVKNRLAQYGPNVLPKSTQINLFRLFFKQFLDPLIYVLLFAALVSVFIREYADASFIFFVLIVNAVIGMVQEYSAQKSAASLDVLVTNIARVMRSGESFEINAEDVVPGDIVLLESGDMVPADLRLINEQECRVDESLLSGESLPVLKDALAILDTDALLQERINMVFSGSLVIHGRAMGVVTATGIDTELGKIAKDVLQREKTKPPLLVRMEAFTWRLTWAMGAFTILIAAIVLYQGMPLMDVFLLAVALAVAAIPEGLPVAITITLAISTRRMTKRNVIARTLVAVEALGSCTFIATDKTGTLTRNEITVEGITLPDQGMLRLPVLGIIDINKREQYLESLPASQLPLIQQLGLALVLNNEAFLGIQNGSWSHHGDSMDVALLIMGHNLGLSRADLLQQWSPLSLIPFESVRRYSASMHCKDNLYYVFTKGAVETIIDMCSTMNTVDGTVEINKESILHQAHLLAKKGYRVLASASANITPIDKTQLHDADLSKLNFLGLTAMIDPLREESSTAIDACHAAGIEVAMLTGDHPTTAFAIASQLNLAKSEDEIITSRDLKRVINNKNELASLLEDKHVYARLDPHQKLDIVTTLQANGHFVAMTGDGANDAPALRAAHVGVAMGKAGTAVARETADIILTDDNFSSIVAGIEEGRIAYNNVRKVIHLLISTGAGEIVLFLMSLLIGLPIPLTAVQLLWLNLVTNGIQHVALAFEPGEGDELTKPPRKPDEPVFNRVMIERVLLAALVIGLVSFVVFYYLLNTGMSLDEARNGTLLLMVLFENIHVINSRSETASVLKQSLFNNKFLIISIVGAQLVHIAAMNILFISDILVTNPISYIVWSQYLLFSLSLLFVSELYKKFRL